VNFPHVAIALFGLLLGLLCLARTVYMYGRPIDILLQCPRCFLPHVDAPEPANGWTNPPHRSHQCHGCGMIWRPADVPTNGVASIRTRGKSDGWLRPSVIVVDESKLPPGRAGRRRFDEGGDR